MRLATLLTRHACSLPATQVEANENAAHNYGGVQLGVGGETVPLLSLDGMKFEGGISLIKVCGGWGGGGTLAAPA